MSKGRIVTYLLSLLMSSLLQAATVSKIEMSSIDIDIDDQAKIQRGAKLFMNYCSGCHSLRYMRYSRMAKDLGLTTFDGELDKDLLVNNLIFTSATVHDPIHISMPAADSRQWFGITPPDLSLSARERGPEWIYTYLKSFYADDSRPFGANNLLVPEVAMPNVLAPLAGKVIAVREGDPKTSTISHLVLVENGEINQQQFDSALQDLVTFLVYVGEPVKLVRYHLGIIVLIFLSIFLVVAYQLKKAYWKKLH
ncbi:MULTISPECIES: cytochrome c1 [Legionella]|uniref:Ubiquinol-cytochrome c reductase cytochrome c1 subunit n=1 Tax=Legionella donaldsonii TaxID=45060 RepID=A0A378IZP3_9GAMM|nr:ubiquinol-cytochrome c reductase cytochrome c1 subunit [Legionella donaldsonii]